MTIIINNPYDTAQLWMRSRKTRSPSATPGNRCLRRMQNLFVHGFPQGATPTGSADRDEGVFAASQRCFDNRVGRGAHRTEEQPTGFEGNCRGATLAGTDFANVRKTRPGGGIGDEEAAPQDRGCRRGRLLVCREMHSTRLVLIRGSKDASLLLSRISSGHYMGRNW